MGLRIRDQPHPCLRDATDPWHRSDKSASDQDPLSTWVLIAFVALTVWLLLFSSGAQAQTVPQAAKAYRADLTRAARAIWGMDAPVATFAAQVHQESAWNPRAVSHVGAAGLTQFMPSTSKWIATLYPDLAENQPFNPAWSLRALVRYDLWLHARVQAATSCERMAMVLSAYNGGLGWVYRDRDLAKRSGLDPLRWWGSVDTVNAGRSAANWRENRDYPKRILQRHEPVYARAQWGKGACT